MQAQNSKATPGDRWRPKQNRNQTIAGPTAVTASDSSSEQPPTIASLTAKLASVQMVAEASQNAKQAYEAFLPKLQAVLEGWIALLPAEAASTWTRGLVYVRESSARSLHGSAPDVQLRAALALAFQKRIFIPPDGLFFDVESGTDVAPRRAFRRLFERCKKRGYGAVVVSVHDRAFRNVEQAKEYKREFARNGVQLVYSGMFEGDRRDPARWQAETFQEMMSESHARNTSWTVGRHFETLSRDGRPLGQIPEVYVASERGPTVLGRQGPVIAWVLSEPLASILKEGAQLYLSGMSCSDLARWSASTELAGVTPFRKCHMTKQWWYQQLRNPKYAGYQAATSYLGFRKDLSKEERRRPPVRELELVPCMLPALWDLDTHRAVMKTAADRWRSAKPRRGYKSYLLTSIAYDAECGHAMMVTSSTADGRFWMQCRKETAEGMHGRQRRADIAQRELDMLLSGLSFERSSLRAQIEDELERLIEAEHRSQQRFTPDPAIAAVKQALATLKSAGVQSGRSDLERQLAVLEDSDRLRREEMHVPVAQFQRAMTGLEHWAELWANADMRQKNELLRKAGVKVVLGRISGAKTKRPPMHLLSITADDPAFALALAVAMDASGDNVQERTVSNLIPVTVQVRDETWADAALRASVPIEAGKVELRRPALVWTGKQRVPPIVPGGPWYSALEVADELGVSRKTVLEWISSGSVQSVHVRNQGKHQGWRLIHLDELNRLLTSRGRGPIAVDASRLSEAA